LGLFVQLCPFALVLTYYSISRNDVKHYFYSQLAWALQMHKLCQGISKPEYTLVMSFANAKLMPINIPNLA